MITPAPAPDGAAVASSQPSVSNSSTFCGLKVCRCKQLEQLPKVLAHVLSRFNGFVGDDADLDNNITRINSFMLQMSAEQWEVCLQGLAEPGINALSPLQLMYADCPVPGRRIMARDIKNLCSPKFRYYLHDDVYSVPDNKRQVDPTRVEVLYEDDYIVAVNKPAGLLTVPIRANDKYSTSLMNRLLGQFPWADGLPRAGLVYRLDLGTSGICLAVKSLAVYSYFKLRPCLIKKYLTVARGNFRGVQGVIRIPLRSGFDGSKKMPACTVFEIKEKFRGFQLMECETDIGRFHQIREHLKKKSHPVVGEYIYQPDKYQKSNVASGDPVLEFIREMKYPCLHASSIYFAHPITQRRLAIVAPVPESILALLSLLRQNRTLNSELTCGRVPWVFAEELSVLYEDQAILIVNKPSGLMTVPHALNNRCNDSVMDRLLARDPGAARMPKAGLLAHLDIGTSGVCLAAKNADVYRNLRLLSPPVNKYLCITKGNFIKTQGVINMPLRPGGLSRAMVCARTRYQVKESFKGFQLLECQMETHCLHQIREHLRKRGHAVVGDYPAQQLNTRSRRGRVRGMGSRLRYDPTLNYVRSLAHPCLHAQSICFFHPPVPGGVLTIEAPEPQRFTELLALLRRHRSRDAAVEGSTGANDVQGSTGGDGVQGSTDADDVQGSTVADGVQGLTDADDVQGATVADGVQGSTVADGVQGSTDADGVQGSTVADGVQDSTGADTVGSLTNDTTAVEDLNNADEATVKQDDEPESVAG